MMLAIAANMIGKLVALQDQRAVTNDQALAVISENLKIGNAQVIKQLKDAGGTRQ